MNADVVVKKSKIHGQGAFANRSFRKGEIVLHWIGAKILTLAEVKKLSRKEQTYVSAFTRGRYILYAPPARFINHSCLPNTHIDRRWMGDRAIRTICKGEEITSDYGYEMAFGEDVRCRCGHKNCRRMMKI
ncbi:MAG: SET domain-containing protein-lysine N-methyltransferase [Patescibacteria group bacterium]